MMQPEGTISIAEQSNFRRSAVTKHLFNCSAHVTAAALCLGAMIDGASAGSFTRGCAARDLQIVMLIEDRESTNAISAERSSDALLTMMNVRMVCHEGRVVGALAIYDSVARSLTPDNFGQRKSSDPATADAVTSGAHRKPSPGRAD